MEFPTINTHHPSASLSPLPQSPERSFISPLPPSPYSARHWSRSRSVLSLLPPSPVRCGRPSSLNLLTQFADVAPSQADLPRPIPAESAVPHSETVVPSPGPTSDDAQSTFHVSEGSPFSPRGIVPSPSAQPLLVSQCVLEKSSQMAPVPSAEIALVARSLPSWSGTDTHVGMTSVPKTLTPDIAVTQPGEGKGRDNTAALVVLGKRGRKAGCNSRAEASLSPPKRSRAVRHQAERNPLNVSTVENSPPQCPAPLNVVAEAPPVSIAQRQLNKAMQCPLPLPQWLVAAMTEVQAMYLHCSATAGYYNNQKKKRKDRLMVPIQRNGCQDPVNCKFNGSSDTEKRA